MEMKEEPESACPHMRAQANAKGCSSKDAQTESVFLSTSAHMPLSRIQGANDENSTNALPDSRQISSIPRSKRDPDATKEEYWIYPSQSQFYEAMKRKSYNPHKDDMSVIVPVHNIINEMAWRRILEWESKYKESCGQPRLKQFMGKPDDPSPKSRLLSWFGYSTPFDRHDWVVDRCGQDVRYVLDFYQGQKALSADPTDKLSAMVSVHIDARPAFTDSLQNAWDCVEQYFKSIFTFK